MCRLKYNLIPVKSDKTFMTHTVEFTSNMSAQNFENPCLIKEPIISTVYVKVSSYHLNSNIL